MTIEQLICGKQIMHSQFNPFTQAPRETAVGLIALAYS